MLTKLHIYFTKTYEILKHTEQIGFPKNIKNLQPS